MIALFLFLLSYSLAGDFSIMAENDVVYGTDQHYTHGTRLSYLWDGSFSCFDHIYPDKNKSTQFSLGQYMYTPANKKETKPILNDRPYCGWLYGGFALFARDASWCDSWELDFGTVGPNSKAKETQSLIHQWIGSDIAQGWDNQIGNELGLDLIYQKKYRWRWNNTFDIIPHIGGSAGNIFTYLNGGAFARLGYNLPDDFGLQRMEPTARVMNMDWFSIYAYADCDNRYVVRNITLDGNTCKESQSIDKEEYVRDFEYGVSTKIFFLSVAYGINDRTKEFKGQPHQDKFVTGVITFLF